MKLLSITLMFACAVCLVALPIKAQENEIEISFDDLQPGALPDGWKIEATNAGESLAVWQVVADQTAPSGKNVLALTDAKGNYGSTYNLCWTDKVSFLDGEVEVKFKANRGREDQGGGVIWRAKDKDNYYIARMNPLENNFRIYFVKEGNRKMLASAKIEIPAGEWHELEISHYGNKITGFIDGKQLLELEDETFTETGGVGLWTKADAETAFDDFEVEMEQAGHEEHEDDGDQEDAEDNDEHEKEK